jgi:proteasome assembly chaperone (PAC2) family protein
MTLHVEWRNGADSLPSRSLVFVAFPGVGNLGKVAVESMRELNDTVELARLHLDALPPQANLDEDGLLAPPHVSLAETRTPGGRSFLTLTGAAQPVDMSLHGGIARQLMTFLQDHDVEAVVVLAGYKIGADRKETFAVASSSAYRIDLEGLGVDVRRDEPKSGAIGLGAMLASTGPLYNINSACVIGTTVGSSQDIMASQRIIEHLDRWFSLGLKLPDDGSAWLIERLTEMAPASTEDLVKELTATHDASYM